MLGKMMALTRHAAILVFLTGGYLAVPLFLVHEAKDVVALEGDNITLDCVFSESAPKCYWAIDNEPIEIGRRYQLIGDSSMGNCTLKIHRVVPHFDEGVWTCGYPKDSYTNYALRSRGSVVKVQVPDVNEKSDGGSGEESKAGSWDSVLADQPEILKDEDLVEENTRSPNRSTEKETNMEESGSGDLQGLEHDLIVQY